MKKAFIEQFLLGFILVLASIVFVATVADEIDARNKTTNIQEIALQTGKTMAVAYQQTIDMCWAKTKAEEILTKSKLGLELLTLKNSGNITFDYNFYDLLPLNNNGTIGDNQPDKIVINISNYSHGNFWYKFLEKNSFQIPAVSRSQVVDAPFTLTMSYGGGVSSNDNLVGTYQLDQSNCVVNTRVLVNSQDSFNPGDVLATNVQSPPTYFFIIPNGGNNFPNAQQDSVINISPQHCENTSSSHTVTIAGTTRNNQKIHFQQNELNNDDSFVQVIPANVWEIYNAHVEPGEGVRSTYDEFLEYCKTQDFQDEIADINSDGDNSNDIIDCITDKNNQYKYGMEDWDQGDDDFNDVFLDSEQFIIPNSIDNYTVDQTTRQIIFDDGYCDGNILNNPPTLSLDVCPITVIEDTPTSAITWTASDSDGTIDSKSVITTNSNSTAQINDNGDNTGTITYTPEENAYGIDVDTITMIITDNEGAIARRDCVLTITEVNDIPTITGTPASSVAAGSNYNFTPVAEDVDGDVLSFTIDNLPSWASFNETNGNLTGTPTVSDVGTYNNINITVSDGRGGTASLPTFSIIVTNDITSDGDINVIAYEKEEFTYNLDDNFEGETQYGISGAYPSGMTLNTASGIITYTPLVGSAGNVYTFTVTASDGINNVSNTFTLTIKKRSTCNTFESNFSSGNDNWYYNTTSGNGGDATIDKKKLIIEGPHDGNTYVYKSFYFGTGCADTDISLTFYYETNKWENSDKLKLITSLSPYINTPVETYYKSKNGSTETVTITTDDDGWLVVFFYNEASKENETVELDNIKLEKK